MYWRIIRTNSDGSVRLLYSGTSPNTTAGHIGISAFNSTRFNPMYVGYMYGTTGSLENNRLNTNNSTIKTYIDSWYQSNLIEKTNMISNTAVYCNDRNVATTSTYSLLGDEGFDYSAKERLGTNKTPTYDCSNTRDAFSVNNIEAKLTYGVGLMTADEISYAGGVSWANNNSVWYSLNSESGNIAELHPWWWTMSPAASDRFNMDGYVYFAWGSVRPGQLDGAVNDNSFTVRPVVSVSECALVSGGNGTPSNPYTLDGSNCI